MSYLNSNIVLIDISQHDKLSEVENQYKNLNAQGIKVNNFSKNRSTLSLSDIATHFPQSLEVHINGPFFDKKGESWAALKNFENLKCLVIRQAENQYPFLDFTWFPNLETLNIDSFNNTLNFEKSNVKSLSYSTNDQDLAHFNPPNSLENLTILGQIHSLNGINKAQNIKTLSLRGLNNLTEIQTLDSLQNLKLLSIALCKKIDYTHFTTNPHIQSLHIELLDTKAKIPSIHFMKKLPYLASIKIQGDIADGDLTPLLELPYLQECWFQNKKKYSHTLEQICTIKNIN